MRNPAICRPAVLALLSLVSCVSLLIEAPSRGAEPSVYVWLEAEKPAYTNGDFQVEATGRPGLLSGGAWFRKSLGKNEVAGAVPREGFLLRYDFRVPEDGAYEVWARVGFEWARAPLEWRIGEGQWARASSDEQTTNVMELGEWMEVAWLRLGTCTLKRGQTRLEMRYRQPGKDGRMLMALDCFALTKGKFVPEGRLKPGEAYDSEDDREAARTVFELPPPTSVGRSQVKLNGLWQVARYDDPDMDVNAHEPV
ncbi:MAG: hypothetical protein ACE5O2_15520, partial [Armatimonadota bacterium]